VAQVILDSGLVVTRDKYRADERSWADHQNRTFDRAEALERQLFRAQRDLELCNPERVKAALGMLNGATRQRTAKHDTECWRRHTGCLADRVIKALAGAERDAIAQAGAR
jgi:hypothetical protein